MKVIYDDVNLRDFDAWSGGKQWLDELIELDLVDEVQQYIEDAYPDGCTDTEINDILWFDDYVHELIENKNKHSFSYEIDIQYTYDEEDDEDEDGNPTYSEVETGFEQNGEDFDTIEDAVEAIVYEIDYVLDDDVLTNLKFTSINIKVNELDSNGNIVESYDYTELVNEGYLEEDVLSKYGELA